MLGVAIDNPNTIDIMSESPRRELVLTISDHLDWTDSKGHQFTLQEKLNGYLRFIESGEVYEHRPKAVGLRIVISVAGQFELDFEGKQFLARAQTIIESAGFGFEYRLFDTSESKAIRFYELMIKLAKHQIEVGKVVRTEVGGYRLGDWALDQIASSVMTGKTYAIVAALLRYGAATIGSGLLAVADH